jgi:hypothetical protein
VLLSPGAQATIEELRDKAIDEQLEAIKQIAPRKQSLKYKHKPTVPMKSMWSGGANNRNNEKRIESQIGCPC